MPDLYQERLVLFLAFPKVGLLDLTGAQTAFWSASHHMLKRGYPGYVLQTVSLKGGLVQTAEGLTIQTIALSEFKDHEIHTIIVPGSPYIEDVLKKSGELTDWLNSAASSVFRIAAVCTGAFLLAQAKLLHSKRAATHWAFCDLLATHFPSINIDRDAIFVQEGKVWSSAGVTAGIDLSLALIEEDCGRDVSMHVARELVVFLKRPGGQAQYSASLQSQVQSGSSFDDLHLWIIDNLDKNLSVDVLAKQMNMSPRNFSRVYKQEAGQTPAKVVESLRLEAARRLLEAHDFNIDQIANKCGFGDEERMRITFQRNLSVSPREYRKRFSI